MAIIQSDVAKGKQTAPYPPYAGLVAAQTVNISVPAALTIGDILEVGVLPALTRIVDLVIATDGVGSNITADVGLVDGEVGSEDQTRQCDDAFFSGLGLTAGIKRLTKAGALSVGSADHDRSIGIRIKGGTTAAGMITLTATYAAP